MCIKSKKYRTVYLSHKSIKSHYLFRHNLSPQDYNMLFGDENYFFYIIIFYILDIILTKLHGDEFQHQ